MTKVECQMEKVTYAGWPNCYRLSNGVIELVATTDVGPRIIRFGFVGGANEFAEFPEMLGKTGGDEWRIYGGHRLWHAPEARPRTYFPDNSPVGIEPLAGGARLIQPTEPTTGIAKEIDLEPAAGRAAVKVTHRLINNGPWAITLAAWGISAMAPGGTAIVPLPPRGSHEQHLAPTSSLALWAYTDLSDPRWTLGRKYILLRHDRATAGPQKIGAMVSDGWTACLRAGHLFIKRFVLCPCGGYPDFGCSVEVFTNAEFLEVETLGPLTTLSPGAAVEHVEHWLLFDNVPPVAGDDDVDRHVLPKTRPGEL